MLAQLLSMLTSWLGHEAETTAYNVVKARTVRGVERAIQELTGDTMTAAEWFRQGRIEPARQERLEASQNPPAVMTDLPTFTRTEIHALKREELLDLIARRGWQIDTEGNVREIREAVFQELDI